MSMNKLEMDLTPPSLTTSPAPQLNFFKSPPSPPETCCPSEGSTTNYSSPALLSRTYNIPSSYDSLGVGPMPPAFPREQTILQPLDAMSNTNWVTPDDMVAASPATSSSTAPNILSAEYDPFATYDPCLSTSFPNQEAYPPPPPNSSSYSQTTPPTNDTAQTPSIASRESFGHIHDPAGSRVKAEGSTTYPPPFGGLQFSTSGTINADYPSESHPFPSNIQYFTGSQTPGWSRQENGTPQLYGGHPQPPASDLGQERRPSRVSRARRPPRKHTTKEEANFQCEVKGCGKFFSRSYNYKSHLETHDEKREYPFPCAIDGCAKKFVRKTDLQRHHQSVHMKERNHKCDYCGRLFARKDTLRRHMEDGCSKRFDIGTLDLRGESYGGVNNVGRSGHSGFGHIPQPTTTLPPITMDPVPPNPRGERFETNNFNPVNENAWDR